VPIDLIGNSAPFKAVLEDINTVAAVDGAVLLQGETGTGKEVVARVIHDASPRRHRKFVAINCAAIPAALLESELFGHERGAFTGAVGQTVGRFQVAEGGTLFLDEIGDLPLELQPKLLRVLQERQLERLGGEGRSVQIDVRVIAASNQDLARMVDKRTFRSDLYYRLNVLPIFIPPLRERRDDIPLLVRFFADKYAERQRKVIDQIPDAVIDVLVERSWPGNVRELQNVIERAVTMTKGTVLEIPKSEGRVPSFETAAKTLADAEREHILATLRATNWVVGGWNGAAARLAISRTTLIAKMQRLGVTNESLPSASIRSRTSSAAGRGSSGRNSRDSEMPEGLRQR
jgi:formate hydrogenlyase transcriptional activator